MSRPLAYNVQCEPIEAQVLSICSMQAFQAVETWRISPFADHLHAHKPTVQERENPQKPNRASLNLQEAMNGVGK